MRKKLGVVGGMGPEATDYFYQEIISHTKADNDQEHIDMLIFSHACMPDRTKAIISGEYGPFFDEIVPDLKLLSQWGAGNIAIPCNTSHYFYDSLQNQVDVPIIHMPRETVREASKRGVSSIGIMATDGTIKSGIYHRECTAMGIRPVAPSEETQKLVMSLIYDDIKAGRPADPEKFWFAFEDLKKQGSDVVILACTEISVFKKYHHIPGICIDAMDILVRESIIRSGAEYIKI